MPLPSVICQPAYAPHARKIRYILAYVHDFLFLSDLYHTVEKFEEIKLMAGKLENGKSGIIWTFFKLTDSILFEQHDKSSPQPNALYPVIPTK